MTAFCSFQEAQFCFLVFQDIDLLKTFETVICGFAQTLATQFWSAPGPSNAGRRHWIFFPKRELCKHAQRSDIDLSCHRSNGFHHGAYLVEAEADLQLSYLITKKSERKKVCTEFILWIRVCVFLGVCDFKEI